MSWRIAQVAAAAVAAVVATIALPPLGVRIALITTCGLALAAVLRDLPRPRPRSLFEDALRPPPADAGEPAEVDRLRGLLVLAHASRLHAVAELTPLLREIAAPRLAARGLSPGEDARRIAGDDLWDLVRPDLSLPADRTEPGPGLGTLRRSVEALESL